MLQFPFSSKSPNTSWVWVGRVATFYLRSEFNWQAFIKSLQMCLSSHLPSTLNSGSLHLTQTLAHCRHPDSEYLGNFKIYMSISLDQKKKKKKKKQKQKQRKKALSQKQTFKGAGVSLLFFFLQDKIETLSSSCFQSTRNFSKAENTALEAGAQYALTILPQSSSDTT